MKTIKILIAIFFVSITMNVNAQSKDKNILKVNYTTGCVSDFLVGMLKKQIQDPAQLSKMLTEMEGYKVHSSFYQNIKTKESIFIIDSISEVEKLSTAGYTYFTYKNAAGDLQGKEIFMGKKINFEGKVNELKWKITDEQKEINGYQCKKAHLEGNSKVYVWFSPEIPVSGGPYIFYGLPGLVLESDNYFESVNATTIGYESKEVFENKLAEVKGKITSKKAISFEEVFAKKENFQRMILKGK